MPQQLTVLVTVEGARLTLTPPPIPGRMHRWELSWTSDASGNVALPTPQPITGTLLKVQFVPGTGGSKPTAGYSVTLTDADGLDVLGGQGSGLSDTNKTQVCPGIPIKDGTTTSTIPQAISDVLTLNVSGAGNGTSGRVILYVSA